MDWQTVLVSFITSCIPAAIAYLSASKQAKTQLQQVEKNNQAELEKMKLEYELKLKEKDNDSQNELMGKFFSGDLNLGKITDSLDDLNALNKKAQKLQNSNFIKNKK
ncbi:MAG: hypothetical protein ACTJHK_03775 [Enterococcus viikkiensis]|uniref:Phage protein n=1 Tax=Enterococcus viikkiensis TaxID=930854 RepID=A0ABU3FMF9_9ENTE|nr:hypothetical protein [Enterococcus viikkiensis]MDT2827162.1 hypothetical protein [Enterococcus viikkiensis]